MDRGTDDRGVSEVMGFILVFGMLVLSFTVYQGIVVPDQNRQVEFEHNQAVQGQFQDLRNAIVSTAATDSGQAVSVTLGASYPTRALARNLGVSGGSLQTTEASRIRIDNAEALDGETRDYLDGSERTFETKSILYTPVYSFYSGAPETIYENTLAYNQFGGTNLTLTDQVVVDGRRITLIAINGTLSKTQRETVSISTEAISTSSNRIAMRNTTGQRVNISVPTRLGATEWEDVLEDEMGSSGYVEGVHDVPGEAAVNISMQRGVTYELRMAKVGVGDLTREERAKYIVSVEGDGTNVPEDGTQEVVVEVRDRFNNPVSNVTVSRNDSSVSPSSGTTGSDGRASFTYNAPADGPADVDIEFSFDGDGTDNETAIVSLTVLDSDGSSGAGSGGTGNINPNDDDAVVLVEEVYDDGGANCGNNNDCRVSITLDNKGSEPRTIEDIRYNFYSVDSQGSGGGSAAPEYVQINGETIELRGAFTDVGSPQLTPGQSTVSMCFFTSSSITSSNAYEVEFGDFYILSVRFDDNSQATYFIPPVSGTPSSVDYDCDSGGSTDPPGPEAFDDANGNGQYDNAETTYSAADLASGFDDTGVDLVIPSDVGTISNANDPVDIRASSITSDVDFSSQNEDVRLEATSGDVDVAGQSVTSMNGHVTIIASGDVLADGSTLNSDNQQINVVGQGISATNAQITAPNNDVTLSATQGAGGELDLTGSTVSSANNNLVMESNGDTRLSSATLSSNNGQATADLGVNSATLYVDQANLDDQDDDLVYDPNGVTVSGTPNSGSVSS